MQIRWIAFAFCLVVASPSIGQTPAGAFLIRDVRLFDGERVLDHRSVLVENGEITRIGDRKLKAASAEVIEGEGRTLVPGMIDAHVHVSAPVEDSLGQALSLGVTTVLDMFTNLDTLKNIKKIEVEDPPGLADVRTAGIGATTPGGHPTQMGGPPIPTMTSPEQAQAFVDARIAEGSNYIKIIFDDLAGLLGRDKALPMLTVETLRALVKAAHKRGKLAVVHIGSELQARSAITAGADGLAHMFTGESASDDFGQLAARHHVFVIPTLSTLSVMCGESKGPALLADPQLKPYIRSAWRDGMVRPWPFARASCLGTEKGLRELIQAHVPILAGTDAPVAGVTYGASLHGELELLVRAGLTPIQALTAATSTPARVFRLQDRGWIRSSMRADLVLVTGDPTRDIQATRNIVAVWKQGLRVPR